MVEDLSLALRRRVPIFLFVSGLCALVYQVAWLRLLRLIFGASTGASAATLGIFMGGLGLGSLLLGPRADRTRNPLRFYARLEGGIALFAALSPFAIYGVARIYRFLGGTASMGAVPGTLLRLVLLSVVLGIPTFLMGGTLPAVVRSVTDRNDVGRRSLGLLYGINTAGAVVGAGATTFVLIEQFGTRKTILLAALLNLFVAIWAGAKARDLEEQVPDELDEQDVGGGTSSTGTYRFVVLAAGLVGFAFFVLELVWYRMLGPILGGSTYTFGVILVMALSGVGLGGWAYSVRSKSLRPTLLGFSATCALEAVFVLLPVALGDHLALLTQILRESSVLGFYGLVGSWLVITGIVVLPAAFIAGFQFPLLVGILGSGRWRLGREIGISYGANTAGAILGSILGGFYLLPFFGAVELWRGTGIGLLVLAGAALIVGQRELGRSRAHILFPIGVICLSGLLLIPDGPGHFWRHEAIGAGRSGAIESQNDFRARLNWVGRKYAWEMDGRESSVALSRYDGFAFMVNGKSDGHTVFDGGTQVMSPLVGALLHPEPKTGLVIGLGTGSSAGWLGAVPSIERVDVYELEKAVLRVARDSAAVNKNVLENPKVQTTIGDGRELLLTTRESYDLIFSEPSNPYRAGISSLFTVEFYRAAQQRLNDRGIFLQWLQAYEIDEASIGTVIATLAEVFDHVEIWAVDRGDLLLVASDRVIEHNVERTRARLMAEPYRSALNWTWGVDGVEGFYSGFVASDALARSIQSLGLASLNLDDHPVLEFGFARNLGRYDQFSIADLRSLVVAQQFHRPQRVLGEIDWDRVEAQQVSRSIVFGDFVAAPNEIVLGNQGAQHRARARAAFAVSDYPSVLQEWLAQEEAPTSRIDLVAVGMSMAILEHPDLDPVLEALRVVEPTEALIVEAMSWISKGDQERALDVTLQAISSYREDPWPLSALMEGCLQSAESLVRSLPHRAGEVHSALGPSFAVEMLRDKRLTARFRLLEFDALHNRCEETFEAFEPYPLWQMNFLALRRTCYMVNSNPMAATAAEELDEFLEANPAGLISLLGTQLN